MRRNSLITKMVSGFNATFIDIINKFAIALK